MQKYKHTTQLKIVLSYLKYPTFLKIKHGGRKVIAKWKKQPLTWVKSASLEWKILYKFKKMNMHNRNKAKPCRYSSSRANKCYDHTVNTDSYHMK